MTWMPTYFKERFGFSLTASSWFTFMSFAGTGTIAILAGWAADRLIAHGRNPVTVRKAFTIAGFVLAFTAAFGAFSHSTAMALFLAVFSLSGLGLATANYWALDPDVDAALCLRQCGGHPEHGRKPSRYRRPMDHRPAGAKNRKLQCAADRCWFLAPGRDQLLSLSGPGEICIALALLAIVLTVCLTAAAQTGAHNGGEWPSYGGDLGNTRYSPLDQINGSNFDKLQIAWRFKTDNLGPRPEYNLNRRR